MYVRKPSTSLSPPNTVLLARGTQLHRVHERQFLGNQFNPCQGGPTRFAPIHDEEGFCIPSLYAGSELDTALFESVFHDIPAKSRLKTITRQKVTMRSHSVIGVARDMTLASLRTPDLKKWRLSRTALIASLPNHYAETALWAQAIHRQFPALDGLVWTSNQCDPDSAYLFFGDRVLDEAFEVVSCRDGSSDASLLADARAAGKRAGITITL